MLSVGRRPTFCCRIETIHMLWGNQEPIELVHEVFERAEVIGSLADPKMPDAMVASKASSGSSSKRSSKASSALKAQAKKDSGRIHPSGEPEAVQTKRSTSPSSKVSKSSVRSSSPKPSERSPASSAGNGHRGKAAQRGKTFPPTPVMRKR